MIDDAARPAESATISRSAPPGLRLRHLMRFARSIRAFLVIPLLLGAAVFLWLNSAFTPSQTSVAEQTMVVSGLDYAELPAVHSYHRQLLGAEVGTREIGHDSAALLELQTPFGEHATAFVIRAEAIISPEQNDSDPGEASHLVDVASTRLLDPATVRDAVNLFRPPSDVQAELGLAEQALDHATEQLDAARERRTRLLATDASQERNEAASQDSWSAAAERDVMVRRVAELEVRADAERLTTAYSVSSIGSATTSVRSGAHVGLLAGVFGSIATALAATAAIAGFAITRRRITTVDQARIACSRIPVVDLTGKDSTDGLAHVSRLISIARADIVGIDMDLEDRERSSLQGALALAGPSTRRRHPTNGYDASGRAGSETIACIRLDSTTGSSVRRHLRRLEDAALIPVALVCLGVVPDRAISDDDAPARPAATAEIGTARLRTVSP